MTKPQCLNKGDKIAIITLSKGLLGKQSCKHELDIAIKRLKEMELEPIIMKNSLKDMQYLAEHPEERAADLKQAFMDPTIKCIITAIGGNDTYKTIPYLMEDIEFINAVKNNPKIFIGFSDTTHNHLMLNKLGLSTFYGPCLLNDIAELDKDMLPYTKQYFQKLFKNEKNFEIESSPIWYEDRESYASDQIGIPRLAHQETRGYETLNGKGIAKGNLYGGCLESLYKTMVETYNKEATYIYKKYNIFPTDQEWSQKILFLETSELKISPETLEKMLLELKRRNILKLVKGVIVGKPIDETYYDEYKEIYKKVFHDLETPVLYNVNFGHSFPRCIIPYNAEAIVDYDNKKIFINSQILENK